MKSSEVYAALKVQLAPVLQGFGFERAWAMLSWSRPQKEDYLVVWFQVSQDGWDSYAGSKFTLEFQLSKDPVVGASSIRRQRFPRFLDANGREEARSLQNEVITSLLHPPPYHPLLRGSDSTRVHYLDKFRIMEQPFREQDDIWLRYGAKEHVSNRGIVVARKLPDCLSQVETWV
jgi:hypothetical protein